MPSQIPEPQDQRMEDADVEPGLIDIGSQRIRVLPGASETAASFQLDNEDHTLGNALRYMIMKKQAPPQQPVLPFSTKSKSQSRSRTLRLFHSTSI
ncbi:MAG: hypothetical protein LQ352_001756 [Teloschistes flavicans]|nr:MAG: hypothetical protein LQ352_001756 [Teloschistes flavicans]